MIIILNCLFQVIREQFTEYEPDMKPVPSSDTQPLLSDPCTFFTNPIFNQIKFAVLSINKCCINIKQTSIQDSSQFSFTKAMAVLFIRQ